jgi:hypothetical protein
MRYPGRMRAVLVGGVLAGLVLGGCTGFRSDLGTADSACYLALPAATKAVNGHGRLIGVHLATLSGLHRPSSPLAEVFTAEPDSKQRICITAFTGHFSRSSVTNPLGLPWGPVAVVVSETPSNRVLGTAILDHPPARFGHTHIG